MTLSRAGVTVRFHGPPGSVQALVAADEALGGGSVTLDLEIPESEYATPPRGVPVRSAPAGPGAMWLVASLPADTAPGSHPATLRTNAATYTAQVDVRPDMRLILSPSSLVVRGSPDARVPVVLTVANVGNVPVTLRRFGAFGVMQLRGVEDAIGLALRSSSEGLDRVAVLADALARRHGGLVVVTDIQGSGEVAPGTVRDLAGTLRVPDGARSGRSYAGTWPLDGIAYRVELRIESNEESGPT